jgi:hypothetical protein
MKVIGHKGSGVDHEVSFLAQFCYPVQKVLAAVIGGKYFPPFNPTSNNVMQGSETIES